jgi:AcrR family transcriptional regulator
MTREPVDVSRPLPRGQHALPPAVVAKQQRRRMFDGMVQAVAEKGYPATTVADVIARAGVSRSTFYEHFSDKEDCFLAAYAEGAKELFDRVLAEGAAAPDDPFARFRAAIRAYLEGLAERPDYTRTFLVEIFAAGSKARERRRKTQRRYTDLIRAWHTEMRRLRPELPPVPDEVFEAAVTAGNQLVADGMRKLGAARLPELEPVVVYTYLSLLGLHEEARAALK